MLRKQLLDTSRGRIVSLLQRGGLTADDVASQLGLTPSAIRIHMTAMERDGVVRRAGKRPGTTRPSHVFELTPQVEQLLSKAYIPLLTQLRACLFGSAAGRSVGRPVAKGREGPRGRLVSRKATVAERQFLRSMIVNLFGDLTYEGGASINGPFLGTLGANAAAISIIAGVGGSSATV